ncbi:MAG TPA: trigger factor [Actinomycetota bacterium]|nr:trigger factor [Actinomycetota bacterium]
MEATLEELERHRVKLTVRVPPEEAKPTLELAFRHLAGSVNVPGFRKGKAPRKVIESQLGRGAVMQEFLEHALSDFYLQALREHDLAPIADPEFEDVDVSDVEGKGFSFTATVDVRPRLSFGREDYEGLEVERPETRVSDSEVDDQLDRLRERFAELEDVGHPARRGDYVTIDVRATLHGDEIPEGTAKDLLYEVGSGIVAPQLDEELDGKRKGDIIKFNATLPEQAGERAGEEVSYTVLVKEVKGKRLPELDDGFAKTSSEFDTLDELREDIRVQLGGLKEASADAGIRDRVLDSLIERVDVDFPDKLVDQETESRVQATRSRAERQGLTLDDVLKASGVDELEFRSDARAHAIRAIKADLALEAVARAEDLQVTDEDLDEAVGQVAADIGRDPKETRKLLEQGGAITSLAGDIIRKKALDRVVERAEVVGGTADDGAEPPPEEKDQP